MKTGKFSVVAIVVLAIAMMGCDRKEEKDTLKNSGNGLSTFSEKQVERSTKRSESDKNALARIGIEKHGDKIVIDLNRTQAYMQQMAEKIGKKSEKIRKTMETGMIRIKEAGIDINDKYVHIDINKTEKALQTWMMDMEAMSKELQESVEEIAKDLNASGLTAPQTP